MPRSTTARGLAVAIALLLVAPPTALAHERPARPAEPRPVPIAPAGSGLDFGAIEVGTTSATQDVIYSNGWGVETTITAVAVAGQDPGDFVVAADGCTAALLPPGGTCTVSVAFAPTGEYARGAELRITDGQPWTMVTSLAGIGLLPPSKVAWGAPRAVGGSYTWTEGAALGRTVSGTTQYLHALVQRYDVSRDGIYYRRASSGATWTVGARLNPSTQYAGRSAIATSGSYVYATWMSFAGPPPAEGPRVVYFRANGTHGSGSWGSIIRLTSTSGRADAPRIAASGTRVYVTWTDAATGSVKMAISRDRGATWRTVTLGTTSRSDGWGLAASPVVAAYGGTVAVAWTYSEAGGVQLRWSSDYGATWKTSAKLVTSGAEPGTPPSISVLGTRVAVAWTTGTGVALRVRTGATWTPIIMVRPSAGESEYLYPWIGQVVLNGASRIGVAWQACRAGCHASDPYEDLRADLLWRESADNGATWARSQVVGEATATHTSWYLPSVLWPSTSTRYVLSSRWNEGTDYDNVIFKGGTGTP